MIYRCTTYLYFYTDQMAFPNLLASMKCYASAMCCCASGLHMDNALLQNASTVILSYHSRQLLSSPEVFLNTDCRQKLTQTKDVLDPLYYRTYMCRLWVGFDIKFLMYNWKSASTSLIAVMQAWMGTNYSICSLAFQEASQSSCVYGLELGNCHWQFQLVFETRGFQLQKEEANLQQ